ncbi:MAG: hypothetical protein RLZZ546_2367 [Bacteroidota bacterium]|jgi:hypothetical protein
MYRHLVLLFLIFSCKSAKEAFNDGDYEKSFKKALKEIQSKKDLRANKSLLNKSLVRLTDELASTKSSALKDKEKLYDRYIKINNYFADAMPYMDSLSQKSNIKFQSHKKQLNDEIVNILFQNYQKNLEIAKERNDKISGREAHQSLTRIKFKYDNQIKDLDQRIEEAYKYALTVYVFYSDLPFNYNEENEVNRQFQNLSSQGNSNYDKVLYGTQYKNLDSDCKIRLSFDDLDENVNTNQFQKTFTKEVEDGYTTEKDTSGVTIKRPKYKTIYATVDVSQKNYQFVWQVVGNSMNNTSVCNFENRRKFYSQISSSVESYQISGDRRAVPAEYLNGNSNRIDRDEILDDLVEDLYNQIRSYYF